MKDGVAGEPQALQLSCVKKAFGTFEVLKEISISARKGEFVCVVGPSGCGKTVLLHLIAGFLKPSEGTLNCESRGIVAPGTDRMMVVQHDVLFPWKTVYGNVRFPLDSKQMDAKEKHARVMKYLKLVGLLEFLDWHPYKLSGGMQQRVALARALVVNPKILLMDEPFSALDSQYRKFLRKNLVEIWQKTGTTILFVTHSINEAVYLADRVYMMSKRPAEIKKEYKVNIPRPRDEKGPSFIKTSREIERVMAREFNETNREHAMNQSLDYLLKSVEE